LANNNKKSNLRKTLLERRDSISFDLIEISSKQIHNKIKQIPIFQKAKTVASYFPIGSEVKTQDIMQEILSSGKTLVLPKVVGNDLVFKKINDFESLEKGGFNIMEPKEECPIIKNIDLMLVPTIGITTDGIRLGYGYGYYDRFLAKNNTTTVSLIYAVQVVKSIPKSENDIKIDWIVTEDEYFKTS
jgi:5-formyltetrahydrofolate cyclo-ligase